MRKIGALSVSASLALGLLAGTSVIANAIPEGDEPTNPPSMEENVGAESDSVADEGTGDPIYGDSSREDAAVTPFALNSSALTVLETWRPALTANSATAAYVDSAADRVYQASRSESPALLFSNSLSASGVTQTTTLPDTTGSWDMTMNGSYLAVGTNGNGVNRPRVAIFDASAPLNKPLRTAVLPTSSSASAYAMSLAPDYTAKDLVWVGTYDPRGAHLYSLNLETGEFTDFTPGTQWQKADIKYVRSVTTTPEGVIVGLGNPGSVWFLANDASQPVEVEGALGGIEVSIVYSLATSPALDEGERPLDPPEQEDPASEQETAMSGQESDRPTGANIATTPPSSVAEEEATDSSISVVAGTEGPASVQLLGSNGEQLQMHMIGDGARTVDRVSIDENNVAWFTVRPSGDLYSWDTSSPQVPPVRRSATVKGAETRAIHASGDVVRGVTGMRQLWTYTVRTNSMEVGSLDRGGQEEARDTVSQGVLQTDAGLLVGGHWRYMVHTSESTFDIDIPGEPKAETLAGDRAYTAIYPSASVFEVNVEEQIATFVAQADTTQVRPRDLVWSEETERLYMATSGVYGAFGGAISVIDPQTGRLEQYATPVDNQMPNSLAPVGQDLIIGTSAAGEAVSAPAEAQTWIVRWAPNGGVLWQTSTDDNGAVANVAVASDPAGDFVFALTANGKALALDIDSGETLWTTEISGATSFVGSGGYLSVRTGTTITEYFPSRSSLVEGLELATSVARRGTDLRGDLSESLMLATVESGAKSASTARITDPRQVTRTEGVDRYATAIAVSRATYASASTAVIATGKNFPDALSAGPLAAQKNGPILLTSGEQLRSDVLQELERLKVQTVFIAGGTSAVPSAVESELRKEGFKVKRLGGGTRFQTSLKIAKEIQAGSDKTSIPAVITTGTVFADALSATPAAAEMGASILLSKGNGLDADVRAYLESSNVEYTVAVGGPAEVAANKNEISLRWSVVGKDRYDTSALVASQIFPTATHAYIATGKDFPDGLSAGPSAYVSNAPMLLARSNSMSTAVVERLSQTNQVTLVGGTTALDKSVALQTRKAS